MRIARHLITTLLLVVAATLAAAQSSSPLPAEPASDVPGPFLVQEAPIRFELPVFPASVQPLLDFRDAEVKFKLIDLMNLLRDHRHEGWVLAAYPDPKTGRPLIAAGVSLDLPEREHPQIDPFNPHSFIEPSSAELWQAAGLDPARLQQILADYNDHLAAWKMRRYRRRIGSLAPEITDAEANQLLRIDAIQAVENARAYCRNFDRLTAPQQMALSQLVYQMGVNLEEFGNFRSLINSEPGVALAMASFEADRMSPDSGPASLESSAGSPTNLPVPAVTPGSGDYWRAVQQSLIQSQWARLYRARAVSVIAMLDPRYLDDPAGSEQRIAAVLHPVVHRHRSRGVLRSAAYQHRPLRVAPPKNARGRANRKA